MGDNVTCNGRGDRGGHCCWIDGQVCQFLDETGPIPRCSIWDTMGDAEWQNAPVGRWFARTHPGYTCIDWPQNIPGLLDRVNSGKPDQINASALCCWGAD